MRASALLVAAVLLLGGCYDVTYPETYACSAEFPQCPAGQACDEANEICVSGGVDRGTDAPADAGPDSAPDQQADQKQPDQKQPDQKQPDQKQPDQNQPDQNQPDQNQPDAAADLSADKGGHDAAPDQHLPDAAPDAALPDAGPDQQAPDLQTGDLGAPTYKWVTVKAGSFSMGAPSTEKCFEPTAHLKHRETQHSVTLTNAFVISTFAVTQARFKATRGYAPSHFTGCADCPVENITWSEAAAYCNALSKQAKLTQCYACTSAFGPKDVKCAATGSFAGAKFYTCPGYRLPTEAEYEFAHRAGTTTALTNGALTICGKDPVADANGWYKYNAGGKTQSVGKKPANAWGLYDMAGNALTWCQDSWSDDLGAKKQTDPVGTSASTLRSVRGASWSSPAPHMRSAFRAPATATSRFKTIGVRCVRTVTP